ncbi:MAG: cytochrome c oxidase accessory protein CcoG [Phycisphaerales bacterium]|nr:cytochrome c oxidase accessory protein CcoG [Planctomycetota bacterium]
MARDSLSIAQTSDAPLHAGSVLSTLNDDGTRRWLRPRVSLGRFLSGRRAVAYILIAIFISLPLLRIGGRPLILLDIPARRFHILGQTFYPTDTLLLALLLVTVFLTIFWLTALFGRVWCGWACPQTVYMEFLFRPIERFFEGAPGRRNLNKLQSSSLRKPLKFAVYFVCCFGLAHVFLAYFVSWDLLSQWVFGSPVAHPVGFVVVGFVTLAMLFNFGYFREQVCLVACPYGRFQSVMLDRHSLTIRYDQTRGEPRKGSEKTDVPLAVLHGQASAGDCVDCRMCVTTCPTGIDIRNGVQMECIGCAQCIDACDAVMAKIHKPAGLIRYSSLAAMKGEKFKILRPRVVLYPSVIVLLSALFLFVLSGTGIADVTVLRGPGQPFSAIGDTDIENHLRLKITNRTAAPARFQVSVTGVDGARIGADAADLEIGPDQTLTNSLPLLVPRSAFLEGKRQVVFVVHGPGEFERRIPFVALGPSGGGSKHSEDHQ